jgi:tetratricopeptide (TPR) repeat protein
MVVASRIGWIALAAALAACGAHRGAAPEGAAPGAGTQQGAALARGDAALREGRPADAQAAYAEAAALAPRDPAPQVGLARAAIASYRIPDAVASADRAVALRRSPDTLLVRGLALAHARRFDDAAADVEAAVAERPDLGEGWALLTCVQVNRGDVVETRWAFAGAVKALGENAAVERAWTLLTAIPPDPVQPQEALDRCTRGAAAMLQARWADANHEQMNGMRYTQNYEWCVAGMAEVAWHAGDLKLAEGLLRRTIKQYPPRLDPLRADAQGRLAAVLLDAKKDPAEAVTLAKASLAARPDRAAVLDTLGRACEAASDVACARDAYTRLLARPHLPEDMHERAEERLEALGKQAGK